MLEDGYGINLIPLANFATSVYGDDPCECFKIHYTPNEYNTNDLALGSADPESHLRHSCSNWRVRSSMKAPEFEHGGVSCFSTSWILKKVR